MPFPSAEHAIVTEEKVRDYLLNPSHPVGGTNAVWFESLGYRPENWQELANDLRQLARLQDDFLARPSPWGVKYEVVGTIGRGDRRPAVVVTVWISENNSPPRLVTAYPG